ncbi:MAG: hypothetical protein QM538_03885 [Methylacidiphilales bacterium]|nr:hypothetical protein [Candidatus Methylacidiphilales bacterium]
MALLALGIVLPVSRFYNEFIPVAVGIVLPEVVNSPDFSFRDFLYSVIYALDDDLSNFFYYASWYKLYGIVIPYIVLLKHSHIFIVALFTVIHIYYIYMFVTLIPTGANAYLIKHIKTKNQKRLFWAVWTLFFPLVAVGMIIYGYILRNRLLNSFTGVYISLRNGKLALAITIILVRLIYFFVFLSFYFATITTLLLSIFNTDNYYDLPNYR